MRTSNRPAPIVTSFRPRGRAAVSPFGGPTPRPDRRFQAHRIVDRPRLTSRLASETLEIVGGALTIVLVVVVFIIAIPTLALAVAPR